MPSIEQLEQLEQLSDSIASALLKLQRDIAEFQDVDKSEDSVFEPDELSDLREKLESIVELDKSDKKRNDIPLLIKSLVGSAAVQKAIQHQADNPQQEESANGQMSLAVNQIFEKMSQANATEHDLVKLLATVPERMSRNDNSAKLDATGDYDINIFEDIKVLLDSLLDLLNTPLNNGLEQSEPRPDTSIGPGR